MNPLVEKARCDAALAPTVVESEAWERVATEIERLEAELAEANAKIEAARESDRIDLLLALGIESPKPTDNGDA